MEFLHMKVFRFKYWEKQPINAHSLIHESIFSDFGRGLPSDGVHPERHEALVHPSSSTKTQPPYILKMALKKLTIC